MKPVVVKCLVVAFAVLWVVVFVDAGRRAVSRTIVLPVDQAKEEGQEYELVEHEGKYAVRHKRFNWVSHPFTNCIDARDLLKMFQRPRPPEDPRVTEERVAREKLPWKRAECAEPEVPAITNAPPVPTQVNTADTNGPYLFDTSFTNATQFVIQNVEVSSSIAIESHAFEIRFENYNITIHTNGTVTLSDTNHLDAISKAFWQAVAKAFPEHLK